MVEHISPHCPDVRNDSVVAAARELLGQHAQFRGRLGLFVFEVQAGVLIIHGLVPSYYLKQLLQTALRELRGVTRIVNRVDVICPGGVSSCSRQTRDPCALEYAWLRKLPACFPTCDLTPGELKGDKLTYDSGMLPLNVAPVAQSTTIANNCDNSTETASRTIRRPGQTPELAR